MNDIERPTAGELAEAVAELANEVDLTRGLNVYVELPGDIAEVLLAALRCAAEDAEKMQEMREALETLAAREVVFDGSDPFEMDCYTPEDARRQGAEDAETLLARTLLGGTR